MIHNNPKSIKAPIFPRKINQLNRTHLADLYGIQAKKKNKVVIFAENSVREREIIPEDLKVLEVTRKFKEAIIRCRHGEINTK